MKIGFDAKRAFYNYRGLGHYARALIEGLCAKFPEHQYSAYYTPQSIPNFWSKLPGNLECKKSPKYIPLWRSLFMGIDLANHGINLFHGLSGELPEYLPQKTRSVVTVHDLIFKSSPEDYPSVDRTIYNYKIGSATKRADQIVAVSSFTKSQLIEKYGVTDSRISVIEPICQEVFFEDHSSEMVGKLKSELQLPSEYLLFIGPVNHNKNIRVVLEAMKRFQDTALVVITPNYDKAVKLIHDYQLEKCVKVYQSAKLSDKALAILYQEAWVTVVPSLSEGFGLPIVESLASGTPVICSDSSALPETCGPGGLFFDPKQWEHLSEQLQSLATNVDVYEKLVTEGSLHAKNYRSDVKSEALIKLYLNY